MGAANNRIGENLAKIEGIKNNLAQLIEWGCTDVNFRTPTYSFTSPDGYEFSCEDIYETLEKTQSNGDLWGCCNRVVDQDIMRCPKCQENV